jgi:hypothetical protein
LSTRRKCVKIYCIVAALEVVEPEGVAERAESRWGWRSSRSNLRDQ